MPATPDELRALAADCLSRARAAGPNREQQLRRCAKNFTHKALSLDLFEHSKQVGRANVTPGSFREYLRARHA